ncbi:GNAT family N-acetyltransferase [Acidocella aromatica]|uniref:Ribosomal protein S18 acetylase RimI-like enzyme n=1 Tax=Acidocella aromatica TaxID=1303579 RepID=A0A840VLU2_9PROT|nr:GNAT family N-acetyltransferase [Acidocella aromatica]MBB5374105.1 ribosomal protein S18 acetylase RimI-like enzyme [Acidocella aromatica]
MSLTVRRARPEDAELLLQMSRDFHIEDGSPLDEAGEATLAHVAAGEALAPAYILELDGAPAGFFILTLGYSVENGGTDGFIDDIYLLPALRGRGLGRQGVALAIEAAREAGIRTLLLEVEAPNERAYSLYCKMGFTDTKRRLLRQVIVEG